MSLYEKVKELKPYTNKNDLDNYIRVLDFIGVDEKGLEDFLNPTLKLFHHPFLMTDLEKAVDRIIDALDKEEKILFFGDYDADGCTTTALFVKVLRSKGYSVDYYVPHRHKDGYGLNPEKIKEFENEYDLLITGDTGIKEMLTINDCKVDVIVTDHHEPFVTSESELLVQYENKSILVDAGDEGTMVIPNAFAVVNPKRVDCAYPNKGLSGVAVVFKLLQGFFIKKGWKQGELIKELDMVAVGLVADLVPQFDTEYQDSEVRMMTIVGMQLMNTDPKPWVNSIYEVSGCEKTDFTALGFVFGPRFNAAGRMDSPRPVVEFLLEEDFELSMEKAQELEKYNTTRKELQKEAAESINEFLKSKGPSWFDRVIVVKADPQYHSGIAGLVSSRLVGDYNVPSIVLCEKVIDGEKYLTGSCRSIEGVNLLALLIDTEKIMGSYKYGGHEMAAGLTIREDQFDEFRKSIREAAMKLDESIYQNTLHYELEVPLDQVSLNLMNFIDNTFYKIRLFSPNNKLYAAPTPKMKNNLHATVYLEKERRRFNATIWQTGKDFCEEYRDKKMSSIDVVYSLGMYRNEISITIDKYKEVSLSAI